MEDNATVSHLAVEGENADGAFDHLTKKNFVSKAERERLREEKKVAQKEMKEAKIEARRVEMEQRRIMREAEKEAKKQQKLEKTDSTSSTEDADGLFSSSGSEIIGREKRVLLNKCRQYKNLFPDALKGFKIKRNPSEEELKAYLDEMQVIVDTGTVDGFLIESVLQCIKLVEGVSSMTKYDLTGMTDILKANPSFHSLSKQLFIKYGCYSNVPPEYQMVILVATTAYICRCKNLKKGEMNAFLNEPVPVQMP